MAAEQRQFVGLIKEVSGGDEVQGRARLFGIAHRVFVEMMSSSQPWTISVGLMVG